MGFAVLDYGAGGCSGEVLVGVVGVVGSFLVAP